MQIPPSSAIGASDFVKDRPVAMGCKTGIMAASVSDIALPLGKVETMGTDCSGRFNKNREDRLGSNGRKPLCSRSYLSHASAGWTNIAGSTRRTRPFTDWGRQE